MDLSPEDSLRLNVLLKQEELQAIRIDESKMMLYALTPKGEATVALNPTGRDEQYLKRVRELLSTHVLGSPGGYPVYLKRWTRMGQDREDNSLYSLLQLGEPEAVVAVVHTPGLTPELARLAWWAMPEAENARRMLAQPAVAASAVGRELAQYLVEYLPFETEPKATFTTIRLVLQPGLVTEEARADLWRRCGRKGTYYIGFLQACPERLPETAPAHGEWAALNATLAEAVAAGNPYADLLCKALSAEGQVFLNTVTAAMDKLADEDASVALFEALGAYFTAIRPTAAACADSEAAVVHARRCVEAAEEEALAAVLAMAPEQGERLAALLALSLAGESLLDSFFSHSDTVGALMRRKLAPWTEPLREQIEKLRR